MMRAGRVSWFVGVLLLSLMLSSCGFQLRGIAALEKYPAIYLEGDKRSEFLSLLATQLKRNQVQLLEQQSEQSAVFIMQGDKLDRRNLTLFNSGQVAEYELIYRLDYQLLLPGKPLQTFKIELYRDYQDDPNRALAKSNELDLILSEMRNQAVSRVLRQLSRL